MGMRSKYGVQVAGKALKVNITQLGQKVLPISEQLLFAGNFIARKVRTSMNNATLLFSIQMIRTVPSISLQLTHVYSQNLAAV